MVSFRDRLRGSGQMGPSVRCRSLLAIGLVLIGTSGISRGGELSERLQERLRSIYQERTFAPESFGPARWMEDGAAYTTLEATSDPEVVELVRYESQSGRRSVLVTASDLTPQGAETPLQIEDYDWSSDRRKLLIFTNTKKVWRRNTRGDYWVLNLHDKSLLQLGGEGEEPSRLMFAEFSPQGDRVAYVRDYNLFVESLQDRHIVPLTRGGSKTRIYGTSDWVYEEEFGLRDGFRWSPEGTRIAFWYFESEAVGEFALINNTDTLYPKVTLIPYPKAGTTNSDVRIGVIGAGGGEIRWMNVPGSRREQYIARMDWVDDSSLAIQHLNRLQNRNDLLLADAATGGVRRVVRDSSDSWVEVMERVEWLPGGGQFLWVSERDGWRHVFRVDRESGAAKLVTRFEADITEFLGPDPSATWVYFMASPDNATQRYLFRSRIDGSRSPQRLSPTDQPGTHSYQLSPDRKWAFHTYSSANAVPVTDLVRLPGHRRVRVLEENRALRERVKRESFSPIEFFTHPIGDEVALDAWMIKPRDFDPSRTYPLLVFVYGEPAGQTVLDRWGGDRRLFHRALAEEGLVVVSFDNRGTPAPRGATWRKTIYGTVGDLSSRDQAAAVGSLLEKHAFLDGDRVGIWGWSGGGSNTLNAMFRFPDVFHVGVSVAPVPDQTLYDTIYQERYMGLPQENEEGYRLGSPIHFAEGLKGRLLLVHGTGDDNVHYQGTERLINRLVELGKRFDLMVYPNRSHSISEGKGTRLHIQTLIARYLVEGLL